MPAANLHENLDSMGGGKIIKSYLTFMQLVCDKEIIDGRRQVLMEEL